MIFNGIQKTSLVNYPGKICTVLFTGGCNLRCKYCYNKDLVCNYKSLPEQYSESDIFQILSSRQNLVDAVTVSGGEPSIYPDLIDFLRRLKDSFSYSIKLDTNGLNPEVLKEILEEKLLDYVAVDIKTSPEKYSDLTGVEVSFSKVISTIEHLKKSGLTYELRTTAIPGYFSHEDIISIKEAVGDVQTYNIQQFINENTLDSEFESLYSFSIETLQLFKNEILSFANFSTIKGV